MSPENLLDLLGKDIDAGNRALEQMPFDLLRDKDGLNLRDYQLRAIQAAEQTIMDGKNTALLAMATGTGKTRTVLGMIYPPALVLILLSFWDGARKRKLVYPLAIAFTSVTSIIVVLATGGFMTIPGLTSFLMDSIPAIVRELLWVGPCPGGNPVGWFLSPAPTAEVSEKQGGQYGLFCRA